MFNYFCLRTSNLWNLH